jgi:hypothetical protein
LLPLRVGVSHDEAGYRPPCGALASLTAPYDRAVTNIDFSPTGPPETILAPEPDNALEALGAALAQPIEGRRDAVADVCARWPKFLDAWAQLGQLARDDVEAYAYFRVGYHRGLDRLRQSGWRGSGYVRWQRDTNRGFLRAVEGLRTSAEAIGELDEAQRCGEFLRQLDPDWNGARE